MAPKLWFENLAFSASSPFQIAMLPLLLALLAVAWFVTVIRTYSRPPLPPGPRGLPLVGSLPFLQPHLHHYFSTLAGIYGPIVSVRLGSKLCVVVNSASLAKEVLKDQDAILGNHLETDRVRAVRKGGQGLGWVNYSSQWRELRKLAVSEILNSTKLDTFKDLWREEIRHMVKLVHGKINSPVNFEELILATVLNVTTGMLLGFCKVRHLRIFSCSSAVRLAGSGAAHRRIGHEAPPDFRRGDRSTARNVQIWRDLCSEGFSAVAATDVGGKRRPEVAPYKVSHQSKLHGPDNGQRRHHHGHDGVGDDKTAATPESLRKAQEEAEKVVGKDHIVEEIHLSQLKYLNAVIKETLRLHPPTPVMLPRTPREACTVGGYLVPKKSLVFVNMQTIQRDPQVWDNPSEFRPERFLSGTTKWDYNGNNLHFFPFGSGRRICIGLAVADRMLTYMLASLLHSFEWNLPGGSRIEILETPGINVKKFTPLLAVPTPRFSVPELYF
ncbi:cytochrome P450 76C2-like [Aristolochia californica]|uniref:cytochrome P450 76C2-like n=1 Tax=Aristolochia californica TaxID=171875 RepID=UPI0035D8501B